MWLGEEWGGGVGDPAVDIAYAYKYESSRQDRKLVMGASLFSFSGFTSSQIGCMEISILIDWLHGIMTSLQIVSRNR